MSARRAVLIPLVLFLVGAQPARGACSNLTQFSTQLDALLAEYDREAPPARAVRVAAVLEVRHAAVLDRQGAVRLLADFTMSWQDERLRWNASEWGCASAPAPAERLWLPDVVCLNASAEAASAGAPEGVRARLGSDGAVAWTARLQLAVPAALQLQAWPHDTQTVTFAFGSREHDIDEIELDLMQLKSVLVFEEAAWEMMYLHASLSRMRGPAGGERSVALWELRVRRRAGGQLAAGGAVLSAAALQLLAAAALPPAQRAPLAAAAAFTTAFWLSAALARLPGGAACPARVCVACALCVCAAACGVCAAVVRGIARRAGPAPRALRALLAAAAGVCTLTPDWSASESGAWAAAAALADYVLMAAWVLAVLVLGAVYLLL